MAARVSFTEFCQRVGFVPLRQAWSEASALIGAFLLIYGIFLVVALPMKWIGTTMLNAFGIPGKVIGYAGGAVYVVWLFKNRKTVFATLEETFGLLKEMPKFFVSLFVAALAVGIVSLKWLPFWLAFGVWLALDFLLAFVDKIGQLGQKYTPPNADALVAACLQRLESPSPTKHLFETTLKKLLRIVSEHTPPEHDLEAQAFAITDAISILALEIKDRKYGTPHLDKPDDSEQTLVLPPASALSP